MATTDDEKATRREWQRRWRSENGKIGATIYLNRHEIDILDWVAFQLMAEDKTPQAVGRPAALRAMLAEFETRYADEIASWALAAPPPEKRASFYQAEIGRRRRGPNRAKYVDISEAERLRIIHRWQARLRNERRRSGEAGLLHAVREAEEEKD